MDGRLLVAVGAAGYGKSTALRHRLGTHALVWQAGGTLPGLLAGELDQVILRGLPHHDAPHWVVIDNVPQLRIDDLDAVSARLARLPATVRVALAARWCAADLRTVAPAVETVVAADLALTPGATAELLVSGYGLADPELHRLVYAATAGWPALVTLAGEHLARTGTGLDRLTDPTGPVTEFVREHVLEALPGDVRRLLVGLGPLGTIEPALAADFGYPPALPVLAQAGIVVDGTRVVPMVAAAVVHRERATVTPAGVEPLIAAARWYRVRNQPLVAAQAYHVAGRLDECAQVLTEHGQRLLASGAVAPVLEMLRDLPKDDPQLRLTYGDALRMTGDFEAALAVYDTADEGLAWRIGLVHYLNGDPEAALDALAYDASVPVPKNDLILTTAWAAAAHWARGNRDEALLLAVRARDLALRHGDKRALAAGFTAVALCASLADDPDERARTYALALQHAEAADDRVQVARIRTNQVHHLLFEARFREAAELAPMARAIAEQAGEAAVLAIAACNEGEAFARTAQFDAAVASYERALAVFQRMGSRLVGCALVGLGDVYRWRGDRVRARAAYEEAIRTAEPDGNRQALVPALAGIVRVLDEPDLASRYAERAVSKATGSGLAPAWCASGWASLGSGDRTAAAEAAARACAYARRRREPAQLAEALELAAAAAGTPERARANLTEAARIWDDAGAPVCRDRLLLALAALPDASGEDRLAGRMAAERLQVAGVLVYPDSTASVEVRVFGRFEVRVDGQPVPPSAWKSRKARDVLRILVARRGRPITRDELAHLLWGTDTDGHPLSVLLSIVRRILDPARRLPTDHYVVADGNSVAINVTRLRVDVEDFLADVNAALRQRPVALTVLRAAVDGYTGDPYEDEPYAEWAAPVREEARAAYARAVQAVVQHALGGGAFDDAVRGSLLLLERDRYDESAHCGLVDALQRAGRHGEARRAYAAYCAAMRDIDVEPRPLPAVTRA